MAKTAFDFMLQHLHDSKTGMFHWLVTREGQLLQDNKVIYGQWFAIYALRCVFALLPGRNSSVTDRQTDMQPAAAPQPPPRVAT
jgi:mannose/cellobiose epimerase-like protein (N-acyl-D-glucosamine 2-epimerase family)